MTKEEFRKKVKELGYQVRFKKVLFDGRDEKFVPIIKKDGENINNGNVFTKDFVEKHKEILSLVNQYPMFEN